VSLHLKHKKKGRKAGNLECGAEFEVVEVAAYVLSLHLTYSVPTPDAQCPYT